MVYSVMQATSTSKETSTATTLMQDQMEKLRNISLASLTSGNDTVQLGNINYSRQWSVSTTGNISTISVTVNWTDRSPHTVSASTLRGN
jgi:hypothetical protein